MFTIARPVSDAILSIIRIKNQFKFLFFENEAVFLMKL